MKTYSFAYGSGDERELRTLVTDAVYERVRVENHDCEAPDLSISAPRRTVRRSPSTARRLRPTSWSVSAR